MPLLFDSLWVASRRATVVRLQPACSSSPIYARWSHRTCATETHVAASLRNGRLVAASLSHDKLLEPGLPDPPEIPFR